LSDAPTFLSVDACIGLHGSASTWVFNVVRELRLAHDPDEALSSYADHPKDLPAAGAKRFVLKSHHGTDEMEAWLAEQNATLILSFRDPRDAAISMAQRFETPLNATVHWLAQDCRRLLRLAPRARLILRYEQRFFERRETVDTLIEILQTPVPEPVAEEIFVRYSAENVRAFAQNLHTLPPERIEKSETRLMDKVTHIHTPHVGDGEVGKWRRTTAETRANLTKFFEDYLRELQYES
jgi:Sulfotransferase domain